MCPSLFPTRFELLASLFSEVHIQRGEHVTTYVLLQKILCCMLNTHFDDVLPELSVIRVPIVLSEALLYWFLLTQISNVRFLRERSLSNQREVWERTSIRHFSHCLVRIYWFWRGKMSPKNAVPNFTSSPLKTVYSSKLEDNNNNK